MDSLIKNMMERADERVCFSVSDKMTRKGLGFEDAFKQSINSLRKGIVEVRKSKIKIQAEKICREDCILWGIEFKK